MPQREPEYLLGITTGIKMISQNLAELHRIEHQRAVIQGFLNCLLIYLSIYQRFSSLCLVIRSGFFALCNLFSISLLRQTLSFWYHFRTSH